MDYNTNYDTFSFRKYQIQKYHRNLVALKKIIFPPIVDDKLNQLLIDDESIKYITFHNSAQEITNVIMNNLNDFPYPNLSTPTYSSSNISTPTYSSSNIFTSTYSSQNKQNKWLAMSLDKRMKKLVITEMTAGVGGNILNFANYFKYVNAIEIDTLRYSYLKQNVLLYEHNNVNCYNDDSLKMLIERDDLVQDIIFFDPPWGGKDYKLHTNLRLTFGEYSIENICRMLFQRNYNKMIIIKLPHNYDFEYLEEELKDYRISKFSLDRMTVVVLKNYN